MSSRNPCNPRKNLTHKTHAPRNQRYDATDAI